MVMEMDIVFPFPNQTVAIPTWSSWVYLILVANFQVAHLHFGNLTLDPTLYEKADLNEDKVGNDFHKSFFSHSDHLQWQMPKPKF